MFTKLRVIPLKDDEDFPSPRRSKSLLRRRWKECCIIGWIVFTAFQIGIGVDKITSLKPLCPYSDVDFESWYWYTSTSILSGFLITWIIMLGRILYSRSSSDRTSYLIFFNILSMGSIATLLSVLFNWGGLCIDTMGVASPAAIWGEWCACGPMLLFTILAPMQKESMTKTDWILLADFFLCLFSGFLIILPNQSREMSIFWMSTSYVTFVPLLFLPFYIQQEELSDILDNEYSVNADSVNADPPRKEQRHNLALWFTCCMPFFGLTYLLAYFKFVSHSHSILLYQFLSMSTKGLYAAVLLDIHKDALILAELALNHERSANESRRAFLKYLFHEVRTPLNSLSIGIEILDRSEKLESEERESLLMMRGASEYMAGTLNDVLSMQKIEEGKLELEMRPFSIEEVVRTVFATFKGSAVAKSLRLQCMIATELSEKLIGDRFRLEHVVGNFLSNAIKFSPQGGGITIEVSVPSKFLVASENEMKHNKTDSRKPPMLWKRDTTEDSYIIKDNIGVSKNDRKSIMVSVSDEGPGIALEHQSKLFGNFVQIRAAEMQNGQGSGLGLSLCKKIVQLHGGKVGVESEEGRGSKFFFIIPFEVVSNAIFDSTQHTACHQQSFSSDKCVTQCSDMKFDLESAVCEPLLDSSNSGRLKEKQSQTIYVLIVDDVESNRKMLRMLLKQSNVVSEMAENGQVAVNIVLKEVDKFDIIFMDNQMPVLGGIEATMQLRAGGYKHLIVGVTGYVLEEDVAEYRNAGADLILSKPLRVNVMNMLLKHMRENGCISVPGMTLRFSQSHPNSLVWVA